MKNEVIKLKHDDEQALKMGMFFSSDYTRNEGYFEEWDEFLEDWEENHIATDDKPNYVVGTASCIINIDSYHIIEQACDDLHEGAYD